LRTGISGLAAPIQSIWGTDAPRWAPIRPSDLMIKYELTDTVKELSWGSRCRARTPTRASGSPLKQTNAQLYKEGGIKAVYGVRQDLIQRERRVGGHRASGVTGFVKEVGSQVSAAGGQVSGRVFDTTEAKPRPGRNCWAPPGWPPPPGCSPGSAPQDRTSGAAAARSYNVLLRRPDDLRQVAGQAAAADNLYDVRRLTEQASLRTAD
jgi:hypothetical protein